MPKNINADDRLVVEKAYDALSLSEKQYTEKSVGFLDPHQVRVISRELLGKVPPDMKTMMCGGYDEAERCMFIAYPEYIEPEIEKHISVIEIRGRNIDELSHRDYLGSLMGLGIKRENIGDILPLDDRCVVFVKPEMQDYILSNLTKIGRHGIKAEKTDLKNIVLPKKKSVFMRETVSSMRLDCVVSAALNMSRAKAAELIKSERVNLNFETAYSVSLNVRENDMISVRNFGRFKLFEICKVTKKGRTGIIIEKYV